MTSLGSTAGAQLPATYVSPATPFSLQAALSQGNPPGKSELQAGDVGLCVSLDRHLGCK